MKAVTTEQIRQLDQRAIAGGTSAAELMERAGSAVAQSVLRILRQRNLRSVLLLAGKGNNGGDAAIAARRLVAEGVEAKLVFVERERRSQPLPSGDVIVDGLLGTGLTGVVREPFATTVAAINAARRPVLAIDIPSGLDGNDGQPHGIAVRAEVTVALGLPKIGLLCPEAAEYVGRIEVADIGLPSEGVTSNVELITRDDLLLPKRRCDAHKGDCGHLLILAGSEGYTGAPVLCAHAAARMGVGLVTLAVPREVYAIVASHCPPEIMPRAWDRLDSLNGFDAVAMGPGLGQAPETQMQIRRWIAASTVPTVVDADALNALAKELPVLKRTQASLVLTPHPGEMGRLIGKTTEEVQAQRWNVARDFAALQGVTLALKGAGTVVTDRSGVLWINNTGNPGMAKGGMGDALTGMIGALLAQGLAPLDAARAGVFLHGMAGDIAAGKLGERALLATDLIANLGKAVGSVE